MRHDGTITRNRLRRKGNIDVYMATTKACISKQVDRLCGLPAQDSSMFGDGVGQAIRDDLGRALATAVSDAHAARMVDDLVASYKFRPTPSEIRSRISESIDKQNSLAKPREDCRVCRGTGTKLTRQPAAECRRCHGSGKMRFVDSDGPYEIDCNCGPLWGERCACVRQQAAAEK